MKVKMDNKNMNQTKTLALNFKIVRKRKRSFLLKSVTKPFIALPIFRYNETWPELLDTWHFRGERKRGQKKKSALQVSSYWREKAEKQLEERKRQLKLPASKRYPQVIDEAYTRNLKDRHRMDLFSKPFPKWKNKCYLGASIEELECYENDDYRQLAFYRGPFTSRACCRRHISCRLMNIRNTTYMSYEFLVAEWVLKSIANLLLSKKQYSVLEKFYYFDKLQYESGLCFSDTRLVSTCEFRYPRFSGSWRCLVCGGNDFWKEAGWDGYIKISRVLWYKILKKKPILRFFSNFNSFVLSIHLVEQFRKKIYEIFFHHTLTQGSELIKDEYSFTRSMPNKGNKNNDRVKNPIRSKDTKIAGRNISMRAKLARR